jgi:hypothetical protein
MNQNRRNPNDLLLGIGGIKGIVERVQPKVVVFPISAFHPPDRHDLQNLHQKRLFIKSTETGSMASTKCVTHSA